MKVKNPCPRDEQGYPLNKDGSRRKKRTGFYILKEEVKAGLRARLDAVFEYYGSLSEMSRRLGFSMQAINEWRRSGKISAGGAYAVHRDYKRNGCKGFRASFCRPDLRFDTNGKPLTTRCDRPEMLTTYRG